MSRSELAGLIGRSESLIEKYESDLPENLAISLAELAMKNGHKDLYFAFQTLAGKPEPDTGMRIPKGSRPSSFES